MRGSVLWVTRWSRPGADEDGAVLAAARRLMQLVDADATSSPVPRVDLGGAQGVQIGDGNVQTNVFGRGAADR